MPHLWVDAIDKTSFLSVSIPKLSQLFNIQSLESGNWQKTNTWNCNCYPQNYYGVTIKSNHTVQIYSIKMKPLNLILKGSINFKNQGALAF